MDMTGTAAFAGIAPDHLAALLAPPLLAAAIGTFLRLLDRAAAHGSRLARRFRDRYEGAAPLTRYTAALLLLVGNIHLALIPAHLAEAPATALLFGLNGLAFSALAGAAFVWDGWRRVAVALLAATLLAYVIYLATGREDLDTVGVATYLLELTTLGLVWLPGGPSGRPRPARPMDWTPRHLRPTLRPAGFTGCGGPNSSGDATIRTLA